MLNLDKLVDFPEEAVAALNANIRRHRAELIKEGLYINEIVREDIFNILGYYCTIAYFPLPAEENDGFHITVPVDYRPGAKPDDEDQEVKTEHFVYLNTEKPIEKQVFAAAHELGHIWLQGDPFWADFPEGEEDLEAVMNRFAAELLMPKELFRQSAREHLKKYLTEEGMILFTDAFRVIAALMDEFCVPAQAVICRFYETGIMKKGACNRLLAEAAKVPEREGELSRLEKCILEGGYTRLLKKTKKKGIKDFPEILSKMEGRGLFSEERIAALREKLKIPKIEAEEEAIAVEKTK